MQHMFINKKPHGEALSEIAAWDNLVLGAPMAARLRLHFCAEACRHDLLAQWLQLLRWLNFDRWVSVSTVSFASNSPETTSSCCTKAAIAAVKVHVIKAALPQRPLFCQCMAQPQYRGQLWS